MHKLLKYLSGNKGWITAIVMTVAGYLFAKGYIGDPEYLCIGTLVGIFNKGASMATKEMYKPNK